MIALLFAHLSAVRGAVDCIVIKQTHFMIHISGLQPLLWPCLKIPLPTGSMSKHRFLLILLSMKFIRCEDHMGFVFGKLESKPLMHGHKVLSKISLCSLHRQIREGTYRQKTFLLTRDLSTKNSMKEEFLSWLACADWGLYKCEIIQLFPEWGSYICQHV